jgi:hypothetical protein
VIGIKRDMVTGMPVLHPEDGKPCVMQDFRDFFCSLDIITAGVGDGKGALFPFRKIPLDVPYDDPYWALHVR